MNQQLEIKKEKNDKERYSINKLRRSELLELISKLNNSLEEKTALLLKERKKNRSFERVLIKKNFREYFREFSKIISIKETNNVRIIFSKTDFFLQPFSIGDGSLSTEYGFLDDQIVNQLGGKSHLLIQDTSKAHNIKFIPGKSFPRSIVAFPIIYNDLKVGCVWVGDENYQAFSTKDVEQFAYFVGEYQKNLIVLFDAIYISQRIITLRKVFNSIEEPILISNKQQIITHANLSAIKEFNFVQNGDGSLSSDEILVSDLLYSSYLSEKIKINNNEKEFEVSRLDVSSADTQGVICHRFIDKTKEKALNHYLSTIISTITQHIRTPMIEIKGLVALTESLGNLSEKQKEFLFSMRRNIEEVEKNVKELLSVNRLNKDRFIEIKEVLVNDCINNAILTLAPLVEQKQITIKYDFDKQGKNILSDAVLLNHVFLNILDYAIRESHLGGIVEIDCYNGPNSFFVSIKDSGKGISKLDIEKMMNDKGIDRTKDEIEITKNIMKILNGGVLVESNLGGGTKITLEFPRDVSKNK
jgi:signal transduction histidine kinase